MKFGYRYPGLLASVWMFVAIAVTVGVNDAVAHAAPEILDFAVAYFATRVLLEEPGRHCYSLICFAL